MERPESMKSADLAATQRVGGKASGFQPAIKVPHVPRLELFVAEKKLSDDAQSIDRTVGRVGVALPRVARLQDDMSSDGPLHAGFDSGAKKSVVLPAIKELGVGIWGQLKPARSEGAIESDAIAVPRLISAIYNPEVKAVSVCHLYFARQFNSRMKLEGRYMGNIRVLTVRWTSIEKIARADQNSLAPGDVHTRFRAGSDQPQEIEIEVCAKHPIRKCCEIIRACRGVIKVKTRFAADRDEGLDLRPELVRGLLRAQTGSGGQHAQDQDEE
jgi:hypothetical protein